MPALSKPQTAQDVLQIMQQQIGLALNPGISQVTLLVQGVQVDEPVGETDTVETVAGPGWFGWGVGPLTVTSDAAGAGAVAGYTVTGTPGTYDAGVRTAGRVQAPSLLVTAVEGGVAVMFTTGRGSGSPRWLWSWRDTSDGFDLYLDESDSLCFTETVGGEVVSEAIVPTTIGAGVRHLAAAAWSSGTLAVFLDGTVSASTARGSASSPTTVFMDIGRSS